MNILEPIDVADPQFGTIVNNLPPLSPDQQEWETKIESVTTPFNVRISLTASQTERLNRIAHDSNKTIDELVNDTVVKLVSENVGAPLIGAPSFARGARVTGFSNSVRRA
jgi:hypothetical protein